MRRSLTTLLLAGAAMLGLASPALAHNVLLNSDPTNGASLAAGPERLTLTFDQPVQQGINFNTVTVTGPNGTRWEAGEAAVAGNVVSAKVRPLGPAGEYIIGYRILSADGHPVTGAVRFTLSTAGTGTPATGTEASHLAPTSGSDGAPVWPWILGAVALLGVGVVVALRLGKGSDQL